MVVILVLRLSLFCQAPVATLPIPELRGGSPVLERICGHLWRANAWPGAAWCECDPSWEEMITHLAMAGYVQVRTTLPKAVQLTYAGAVALQVVCTLGRPKKILLVDESLAKAAEDREAAEQLGVYELLCGLKQRSWTCVVLPARARKRVHAPAYQRNGEGESGRKIWWVRSSDAQVKQWYLLALYLADLGLLPGPIPHLEKAEFYQQMVTGKAPKEKQSPFVFESLTHSCLPHAEKRRGSEQLHGQARAAPKQRLLPPASANEIPVRQAVIAVPRRAGADRATDSEDGASPSSARSSAVASDVRADRDLLGREASTPSSASSTSTSSSSSSSSSTTEAEPNVSAEPDEASQMAAGSRVGQCSQISPMVLTG